MSNDFVFVSDVADAIIRASLATTFSESLNIGSGKATAVIDVLRIAAKYLGAEIDYSQYDRAGIHSYYADKEETLRLMQWQSKTDIEEGIRQMIDFSYIV